MKNRSSSRKILISSREFDLLESIIDAPITRPRLINTDRRAPHRRSLGTGKNGETSSTGFVISPLSFQKEGEHETVGKS